MTNLTTLAKDVFEANKAKGFWDNPRPLTETTMLIVTELAEAVEEERAGRASVWYLDPSWGGEFPADLVRLDADHLARPHLKPEGAPLKPEGVDVELIDSLIRLLDLLGSRGTDVDELLRQKLAYNREGRGYRHGKAY